MGADVTELAARFDRWNMAKVIERVPNQIETALAQELPPLPAGPFRQAVVSGMGGSALPADVVIDAFGEELAIPLRVSRHYELPPAAGGEDLVIASSFSGDTEEVLASVERFPPGADHVVVVSSGGRLGAVAEERGFPFIRIPVELEPEGFQPRSAVGYVVTYMARILHGAGALADPSGALAAVPPFLRDAAIEAGADAAARWLGDRIPVIYTDERHLASIARIAKIKFNENAKRQALFNALPEVNHNEMIGFSKPLANFGILYLHDPASHPRVEKRFQVMQRVFEREGLDHVSFRQWEIPGTTAIQKIFAAITFAERAAYTLALLDGLDPTPVELVEKYKKVLAASEP